MVAVPELLGLASRELSSMGTDGSRPLICGETDSRSGCVGCSCPAEVVVSAVAGGKARWPGGVVSGVFVPLDLTD